MNPPLITVLLPVYNGEKYLKYAIESVLCQSFSDFEFIIINDGSDDESENIIKKYQQRDNRIIYLKNEKNLGLQRTLNKGLSFSKTNFIARIDSDDTWCDKNKLQKQFDFLQKNPDYALIGTAMKTINENGGELQTIRFKTTDKEIRDAILFSSQFAHPSVMISAKALDEIGFYSEEKKHKNVEDYELWLRIGTKYKFANLSDICLKYRVHPESISMQNEFKNRISWIKLTWQYSKNYPNSSKALLAKIASLAISRKFLDAITKKNRFFAALYSKISGIKKN